MRDIRNNLHGKYDFRRLYNEKNTIISISKGDLIELPISYPIDIYECDCHLYYLNLLMKEKIINCPSGIYDVIFDVSKIRPNDYKEWKKMIDYAKKHCIQFKINEKTLYTAKEMENYINRFTIVGEDGSKQLVPNRKNYKLKNNPLIQYSDEDLLRCELDKGVIINEQVKETIDQFLKDGNQPMIVLCRTGNGKFDKNTLKHAKIAIDHLKEFYSSRNIDVSIYSKHQYFDKEEFRNLLELEKYIRKKYNQEYELKFYSGCSITNKKQILNANNKITSVVNYLKKSKLSPYEKILFVHKLLSEIPYYNEDFVGEDAYAALNSRNIVCVTYSTIFSAIFNELNYPNIKTEIQIFDDNVTTSTGKDVWHALNMVYVRDKKYDIDGYYGIDITSNNGSNMLNNFMVPIEDIMNVGTCRKRDKVSFNPNDDIKTLMYFYKRSMDKLDSLDVMDYKYGEVAVNNTLEFLDTPMGRECLLISKKKKIEGKKYIVFDAINGCLDKSKPIKIQTTQKALEKIADYCFGMSRQESLDYAKNIIISTVYYSIFAYDRQRCMNDFSKVNLEIEKGKLKIINGMGKKK
jgi:hypothetical protein